MRRRYPERVPVRGITRFHSLPKRRYGAGVESLRRVLGATDYQVDALSNSSCEWGWYLAQFGSNAQSPPDIYGRMVLNAWAFLADLGLFN